MNKCGSSHYMRKLFYILIFIIVVPFGKVIAQQGLSVGIGGGPNYFYGSIIEAKNIGFSGSLDARYNFSDQIHTTLSYSFNKLQASQLSGAKTAYYFDTNANNLDLHIGFNILQLAQIVDKNSPLRITLDMGFGISFYDEGLYYGDANPSKENDVHYGYQAKHGKGSSPKYLVGGEASYSINDTYSIFFNFLGHHYFTSEVDGKSHYINDPATETYNDNYFTMSLGARYYLDTNGAGKQSKTRRKSPNGFYRNDKNGSIFQNFRFNRYSGKKSPKQSIKSNKSKQPRIFPGGRFQGKKSNGGVPK